MSRLSTDVKYMPLGIDGFKYLLVVTCEYTNFVIAIPLKDIQGNKIAEALIHRVITIFGIPDMLIIDKDRALMGQVINLLLSALQCTHKIISPYNYGSSKTERQFKTILNLVNRQLTDKGQGWLIFTSTAAYAVNSFTSDALNGSSPYELVFVRATPDLTKLRIPDIGNTSKTVKEYYNISKERVQLIDVLYLNWKTSEALSIIKKLTQYKMLEIYEESTLAYLLAPHTLNWNNEI